MGYIVNPGTNETNAPVPIFSLTPSATVDEGNNLAGALLVRAWLPMATRFVQAEHMVNHLITIVKPGVAIAMNGF